MRKTLIRIAALISVLFILSCRTADETRPDIIKYIDLEPEIWFDNYLSPSHKDTIEVRLWSNSQRSYLDSIPDPASMESSMDWTFWFQDNEVEAVLFLKGFAPLRIPDAVGLHFCGALEEDGRRAIAIVLCYAYPTGENRCDIYTLEDGRWKEHLGFSTDESFTYSEEGEEPELTKEWLVRKEGRWMYRDYLDYLRGVDSSFHYVF